MKLWRWLPWSRSARVKTAADPLGPRLAEHKWTAKAAELSQTGLVTMALRLPALLLAVMRLGRQAAPRDLAVTVVFNVVSGVFTAFGLLATTGVLSALFAADPTPARVAGAAPALLLVGAAVSVRAGCSAIAQWAQGRLRPQVEQIVERRLYEVTTAVDLAAFDDSEFQDDLHRARLRGIESAPSMVDNAVDLFTASVGVVAAAGALGVLHPVLLPLLLLTALPEGWAAVRAARLGYLSELALVEVYRRSWIMTELMTERSHAAEVRSFTVRGFLLRRYARLADHIRARKLGLARRQTLARIYGDVLKGVATMVMYAALGLLLWRGIMPLAVAGTAVLAIRTGQNSLINLVHALNRCYEDGLYFADYLSYCQMAEQRIHRSRAAIATSTDAQAAGRVEALRRFQQITADQVTFAYPGSDTPAVRQVSVRLGRGEIIALVGENGSGKTTLAKILAGLYTPQAGQVRWDETPVTDLEPQIARRAIAVIAQDHTHWPMNAADNIAMGDDLTAPGVREAVEHAATTSGADQVIATLPNGLDTLLDKRFDGGQELSGGQWQRLAAARGFYRDAPLLICDEPTAALDARAEHHLFEQIRDHARANDRTVLLITHRLASVRHADRIYVLDGGQVTEHGDHHELMNLGGLYAELYTLQASAYQHRGISTHTAGDEHATSTIEP
ncbi:ABC transporter ATP-binding protein/permease [Actinoallomurus sp. NBC_01490]|uniref:ABC transporter ATP-binding protein n=1 Tax=Actinoallomurus sp. NBC_01490 TaxID=2903557 RepID=UPI002E30153A|nr:ABC transporter ATP-binding protein [Actinoallomurus sp. NBC_01490]